MIAGAIAAAAPGRVVAQEIVLREGMALGPLPGYGRVAVVIDPVADDLVRETWRGAKVGDEVSISRDQSRTWEPLQADDNGWFGGRRLRGGYLRVVVNHPSDEVLLLDAVGHSMVYVNGAPRGGDPYGTGVLQLPVRLHAGENEFLFLVGRGRVRATLRPVDRPVILRGADLTLPDLVVDEAVDAYVGVVVLHAEFSDDVRPVVLRASGPDGLVGESLPIWLTPRTLLKAPVHLRGPARAERGEVELTLTVHPAGAVDAPAIDTLTTKLRVRGPYETRKRTFISDIDGSVQYYAVQPWEPVTASPPLPALFLTLHGASVEALGQAAAYANKSWGHIVAPTNRRPFGFDWEDWGRSDAREVLAHAQAALEHDPARLYLTGHSMGGHGTIHLGVTFPGSFAAIGPSAGWISFWSYGGGYPYDVDNPIEAMLRRAANPSDTLALLPNLLGVGVYSLHGDADDNVPVSEARDLRKALADVGHRDMDWHEQPGAGHWWGGSPEPGAACVDWPAMFDFFARHALPPAQRDIAFVTMNPAVSSERGWVQILQQEQWLLPSRVALRRDPHRGFITGHAENVAMLRVDCNSVYPAKVTFELDQQVLADVPLDETRIVTLVKTGNLWQPARELPPSEKYPERAGPFKQAFDRRFVLVYGTRGSPAENAWSYNKARFDAETWYIRGNGRAELVADRVVHERVSSDQNLIVYGNADTNGAWRQLRGDLPVNLTRTALSLPNKQLLGDLAALFVFPRSGSDVASVGVVGGSSLAGCRAADRLPYFVSGVAYPDVFVIGVDDDRRGLRAVRAAGFFDRGWRLTDLVLQE